MARNECECTNILDCTCNVVRISPSFRIVYKVYSLLSWKLPHMTLYGSDQIRNDYLDISRIEGMHHHDHVEFMKIYTVIDSYKAFRLMPKLPNILVLSYSSVNLGDIFPFRKDE